MEKYKIGIVGATGYAGVELVRLLLGHPNAEIAAVSSVSFEGKKISEIYPNLSGCCDMTLTGADAMIGLCDVIFAALPHGLSEELAYKCSVSGKKTLFIDIGADFRLHDEAQYEKWYKNGYKHPELHDGAVYCIPELHRALIRDADIIGNPGCYPTSIALGLMPALKKGLIKPDGIIIDSKSGVTGAGRSLTQGTHFPDTNEAFAAYKAGAHRHTPEIEQTLSELAGREIRVTFVPHLLPVNRGIESTIYAETDCPLEEIYGEYTAAYKDEKFVRMMPLGEYANLKNVRCSNYCDISLHADPHTKRLIISSVIDNMVKGAAGQAIQNMNIRLGIAEATGLDTVPTAF